MRLKDAVASLQQEHPEDNLLPLYTPWGEEICNHQKDVETIWQEYPRPALRRTNYHMLNGCWKYTIVPMDTTLLPGAPIPAEGNILVPFSPESLLSGVNRQLKPGEYLWYERELSLEENDLSYLEKGYRCILHFGAADQEAVVYVNGKEVTSHIGGYLPFSADITDFLLQDAPSLLQLRILDESDTSWQSRGKQTLKRGGMFYTAQSGIWQSVWYEWVPENYIRSLQITPNPDNACVTIRLDSPKIFSSVSCTVYKADENYTTEPLPGKNTMALIGVAVTRESSAPDMLQLTLPADALKLWTPEHPYLYGFTLLADKDIIHGYFALRTFSVEPDENGIQRFCLNHKPYFLHGLLDQGYWPDGLMTAPCDEAFLYDIQLAKKAGFNMLRKHIKIEPMRWYYHCDRLGMIVWQDMVSGGSTYHMPLVCYLPTLFPHICVHTKDSHYKLFSRGSEAGRRFWEKECLETVDYLYNVPSIAVWVPFNEGWGQFDANRITALIRQKDSTRPVDHASGWFDQKGGDFKSVHNYFRKLKAKPEKNRAYVISEYGGFACHIPGHSSVERIYGYKTFTTTEEMNTALDALLQKQLFPLVEKGLSGAVYTQLSDVEEEVNGLVTYDRKVVKIRL